MMSSSPSSSESESEKGIQAGRSERRRGVGGGERGATVSPGRSSPKLDPGSCTAASRCSAEHSVILRLPNTVCILFSRISRSATSARRRLIGDSHPIIQILATSRLQSIGAGSQVSGPDRLSPTASRIRGDSQTEIAVTATPEAFPVNVAVATNSCVKPRSTTTVWLGCRTIKIMQLEDVSRRTKVRIRVAYYLSGKRAARAATALICVGLDMASCSVVRFGAECCRVGMRIRKRT